MLFATGVGIHISSEEELHKQKKVAHIHDENTGVILKPGPATWFSNGIEGYNTDNTANHHLCYLSNGNPFGIEPFWLHLNRHEEVVEIHNGVNAVVDCAVDQSRGSMMDVGVPGTQQDRDMMVPMQHHEILFVRNDKDCVNELSVGILDGLVACGLRTFEK